MNTNLKLIVILVIMILILAAVGVLLSDDNNNDGNNENGSSGEKWQDLNHFREFLNKNYTVIDKDDTGTDMIEKLDDFSDALWIIIGVESEFLTEESSAVRNFVHDGGNLILAADSSLANKISRQFGIEYSEHRIYETERYDKSSQFIPLEPYIDGKYYYILTNSPIGLVHNQNLSENFKFIANSSDPFETPQGDYSFLDLNDNGQSDITDDYGPIPAIVEVSYGSGRMIYLSDSAIFTDDLWSRETATASYENSEFCKALVKNMVSKQGTVIYDYSKHINKHSGHLVYRD